MESSSITQNDIIRTRHTSHDPTREATGRSCLRSRGSPASGPVISEPSFKARPYPGQRSHAGRLPAPRSANPRTTGPHTGPSDGHGYKIGLLPREKFAAGAVGRIAVS